MVGTGADADAYQPAVGDEPRSGDGFPGVEEAGEPIIDWINKRGNQLEPL